MAKVSKPIKILSSILAGLALLGAVAVKPVVNVVDKRKHAKMVEETTDSVQDFLDFVQNGALSIPSSRSDLKAQRDAVQASVKDPDAIDRYFKQRDHRKFKISTKSLFTAREEYLKVNGKLVGDPIAQYAEECSETEAADSKSGCDTLEHVKKAEIQKFDILKSEAIKVAIQDKGVKSLEIVDAPDPPSAKTNSPTTNTPHPAG